MTKAVRTRRLIILGSTGSIGRQALGVVAHVNALAEKGESPVRFDVVGLSAGSSGAELIEQARAFGVRHIALSDTDSAVDFDGTVTRGKDASEALVRSVECDIVVAAIVGFAGLGATMAAVGLGRDVALANKETLVAAGGLIVPEALRSGTKLLPIDSEHSGVWQALGARIAPPFETNARITLTASGGPFLDWSKDRIASATPEMALAHPTWDMGEKVTVDSASLTNKALELIEARWLFGAGPDSLDALIQPGSVVHALVEHPDGSVVAQLGAPDMRCPIQLALCWPDRIEGCAQRLDLRSLSKLEFIEPDLDRFPALALAFEVLRIDEDAGGPTTAGAAFNGANEAAVGAFLDGRIPFGRIPELSAQAVRTLVHTPLIRLSDAVEADAAARAFVEESISQPAG